MARARMTKTAAARTSPRKGAAAAGALATPPPSPPPSSKKASAGVAKRIVSSRAVRIPLFFMHEYVRYYGRVVAALARGGAKVAAAKVAPAKVAKVAPAKVAPVKVARAAAPRGGLVVPMGPNDEASPEMLQFGTHYSPPLLTADARAPNIEVCFSFDTTGSMSAYINVVKERIQEIARTLVADLPDIRISVIAHGDYCDAAATYVLKRLDLSNDANGITNFIQGITATFGGDGDECYEYVLQQARGLSWTPGTARALVVVGDASPHLANQYYRIDWEQELAALIGMDVRCYGVRCGGGGRFYDEISDRSGGKCLSLDKITDVVELIMGLCYREAAVFHMERPDAPDHGANAGDMLRVPQAAAGAAVTPAERERHVAVHRAIHDLAVDSVTVDGVTYRVSLGGGGCRWVKVGDMVYIEQTKEETSRYAALAQEGRAITWMLRRGQWGMIMDGEVHGAARPESAHDAFVPDMLADSRIGEAPAAAGRRRRR